MPDEQPSPEALAKHLDELQGQIEGMQSLMNFLLETLSMNVSGESRKRLHDELLGLADYYGDEPEALPFRQALRAIAQPRPQLRLVRRQEGE